jgi:AcrR family transcriptional regulator
MPGAAGLSRAVTSHCRPSGRGEAREQAIIDATLYLLAEIGYEAMTMDAVAAHARASKATIYRRWQGKPQLVGDALRRCGPGPQVEIPHTGSLRGDLVAMLRHLRDRFAEGDRALLAGVLHAMQRDPELAGIMRTQLAEKRAALLAEIKRRALLYGIDPVGIKQVAEVMPGSMMMRLLVTGDPVDDEFVTDMVDHVLIPLLTRKFSAIGEPVASRV